MRPPNVLQPVLASVGDDAEHPRVEPAADFRKMLVRLDETELQNVFRNVRTTRHTQGVTVQRVAVPRDQDLERIPISTEDALNDQLIGIVLINWDLISPQGGLRRLHDNRVTYFPRFGQGTRPAPLLDEVRHVVMTTRAHAA
jgi:hypothetical protein